MRTLADFPDLLEQWHPEKNGAELAANVRAGSHKKAWWVCPKAHEFLSSIKSRAINNTGCPYCSGNRVSDENNLQAKRPEVAAIWHPTKNGELLPKDVMPRSERKVWWICPRGHEHFSPIKTRSATNCPYCLGKKAGPDNNLQAKFPDIAAQWHPIRNGDLKPTDVLAASNQKVWWQCDSAPDHEWETTINKRTVSKSGCPFCGSSPMRASSTNNLAIRFPDIAKYWHPTKNGNTTPQDVLGSSYHVYWWLCEEGHHFRSKVHKRTDKRSWSCPYCSGKRVGQGNSLADKFPAVAADWDYEKNGDMTPDKIASKSNKRFWFTCPLNHSYRTAVSYRTSKDSGCPNCTAKSSQQELRVYSELKWIFSDSHHRYKIDNIEFDVFVPSLNLAVEYDGAYWHRCSEEKDNRKSDFCAEKDIKIVRVREEPLPKMAPHDVVVPIRDIGKLNLDEIVRSLQALVPVSEVSNQRVLDYLNASDFLNDSFFEEHKTYMALPHPSKSLAATHPEIARFWDYERNSPLKPEQFTYGSGRAVYWVCRRGHSYQKKIAERRLLSGCPVCNSAPSARSRKSRTINDKRQIKLL